MISTLEDIQNRINNFPNIGAFLSAISFSEGTNLYPDPYKVIVGSTPREPITILNFNDHPRKIIQVAPHLKSDAAGRYQIMSFTWDDINKTWHLPDFSTDSQDKAAVILLMRRDALADVEQGNFESTIIKCSREWASLPGADYGQHENKMSDLINAYNAAGGTIITA